MKRVLLALVLLLGCVAPLHAGHSMMIYEATDTCADDDDMSDIVLWWTGESCAFAICTAYTMTAIPGHEYWGTNPDAPSMIGWGDTAHANVALDGALNGSYSFRNEVDATPGDNYATTWLAVPANATRGRFGMRIAYSIAGVADGLEFGRFVGNVGGAVRINIYKVNTDEIRARIIGTITEANLYTTTHVFPPDTSVYVEVQYDFADQVYKLYVDGNLMDTDTGDLGAPNFWTRVQYGNGAGVGGSTVPGSVLWTDTAIVSTDEDRDIHSLLSCHGELY